MAKQNSCFEPGNRLITAENKRSRHRYNAIEITNNRTTKHNR